MQNNNKIRNIYFYEENDQHIICVDKQDTSITFTINVSDLTPKIMTVAEATQKFKTTFFLVTIISIMVVFNFFLKKLINNGYSRNNRSY